MTGAGSMAGSALEGKRYWQESAIEKERLPPARIFSVCSICCCDSGLVTGRRLLRSRYSQPSASQSLYKNNCRDHTLPADLRGRALIGQKAGLRGEHVKVADKTRLVSVH